MICKLLEGIRSTICTQGFWRTAADVFMSLKKYIPKYQNDSTSDFGANADATTRGNADGAALGDEWWNF